MSQQNPLHNYYKLMKIFFKLFKDYKITVVWLCLPIITLNVNEINPMEKQNDLMDCGTGKKLTLYA
jgi:hypothetical protein